MKNIILIGGGKHCKTVIEILGENSEFKIWGISDLKEKINTYVLDYQILLLDENLKDYYPKIKYAFVSHGKDLKLRKKLFDYAREIGFKFPTLISNSSNISKYLKIGEGTIIMKNSLINTNVNIGNNCIINSGSIVEHDCEIGNHVHISPGAVISGDVKIGDSVHIGANATIIDGVEIGNNSIIGAGSVVINDIAKNSVAVGNPTKIIKKI